MIPVRHLLVTAALVLARAGRRRTVVGIRRAHFQDMLIVVSVVGGVQATVVQVIDMAVMTDAGVATVFAVDVLVIVVGFVCHGTLLLQDRVAQSIGPSSVLTIV